ncbi:MAG: hypothetical protein U0U09_07030, partial [Cyclobacteriaceae bacterium]
MKMLKRVVLYALIGAPLAVLAQPDEIQYNPNSLDPIARYEQHYKRRVWRTIDLREKQNKGFFARNGEISKLIMEAAKSGEIAEIFQSDSLKSKWTKEEFQGKLQAAPPQSFPAWDP